MKKIVNVQNIITGMTYGPTDFYSDESLNAWISKQTVKCASGKSWGWSERRMPLDECPSNLQVLIVETYPVLVSEAYVKPVWALDENGNIVTEEYEWTDDQGVVHVGIRNVQVVDASGNLIFENVAAVYKDWVRLKPEYEITITDVTEAHDAELASKEARLLELQQLRQAENIINGWTSINDIGLPFLKKFFKRIIKELRD